MNYKHIIFSFIFSSFFATATKTATPSMNEFLQEEQKSRFLLEAEYARDVLNVIERLQQVEQQHFPKEITHPACSICINEETKDTNYLHKGISTRNFTRNFPLAENVEVRGATVKNGILSVALELVVPEEQKPKKIAISFAK